MINEQLTFEKFGYHSYDWSEKSEKRIVVVCDKCGKVREVSKLGHKALCKSCSKMGNQSGKNRTKESYVRGIETRKKTIEERGYYFSEETLNTLSEKCGIPATGTKYIHNIAGEEKRVAHELVEDYLDNGWSLGFSNDHIKNNNLTSKETREKQKNSMIGHVTSEETKNKIRVKLTGTKHSDESYEKAKITWKQNKDKNIFNILKASHKRPNNFEIPATLYLNILYGNKFIYTGNGSFIRNGRSADAVAESLKMVALFHGIYYHWNNKHPNIQITEADRRSIEKVDSLPFLAAGYKVIVIWEDEFNQMMKQGHINDGVCKILNLGKNS